MVDYTDVINKEIDYIIKKNIFGFDFTFSTGQKEVVTNICNAFLNWINGKTKTNTVILSAPTGYGKSIISMFTSKILQNLTYKGYILTVDLTLQQQYEFDFKKFNLSYHSVKGADNYKCFVNSEPFSKGDCHSLNLSYKELTELSCYSKCSYLQARLKAMQSPVSLLNYSYWLIQRNKNSDSEDAPFKLREFVFFDECHKIDDIIQNHFSIKLTDQFSFILQNLKETLYEKGILVDAFDRLEIAEIISNLFSLSSPDDLYKELDKLGTDLKKYVDSNDDIQKKLKADSPSGERIDSDWSKILYLMKDISDIQRKIFDYLKIVDEVGMKNIIKRVNDSDLDAKSVEFLSLKDDFLIKKYLLNQSGFKIFMSATLGNINQYARIIGVKDAIVLKLKSPFNFDKSPIFFSKKYGLDYKNKVENLPKVVEQIDDVISKHFDENGIIHTGSFEFANYLFKNSKFKSKFITYRSDNKRTQLKKFLTSKGKIFIGPSILEGLDLKDDLCRYQIFMKIPFPNISDPLIKSKLNESREWYLYKTALNVEQGVGRVHRNINDFGNTYILDNNFVNLLKEKMFDLEFMKRLKVYE